MDVGAVLVAVGAVAVLVEVVTKMDMFLMATETAGMRCLLFWMHHVKRSSRSATAPPGKRMHFRICGRGGPGKKEEDIQCQRSTNRTPLSYVLPDRIEMPWHR